MPLHPIWEKDWGDELTVMNASYYELDIVLVHKIRNPLSTSSLHVKML